MKKIEAKREHHLHLTIYTRSECIYCNELKGQLKKIPNISYSDIDIDELGDLEYLDWFYKYKTTYFPVINVEESDYNKNITIYLKTDLAPTKNIIILDDINEIINYLKSI